MITEDLSVFFDQFAQPAEIRTAGGALVRSVSVIINTPTQDVAGFDASIEAGLPFIYVASADLSGVTHSHKIVTGGVTYRIAQILHDGTGVATVQLRA